LLAGADLDGAKPARYRFDTELSERNRTSSGKHEMLVEAHAVTYKEGRHADAAALLQDGEVRIVETKSEDVA